MTPLRERAEHTAKILGKRFGRVTLVALFSLLLVTSSLLNIFRPAPPAHAFPPGETTYNATNSNVQGDDACGGPFNFGFNFNFYGQTFANAYFNTNGTLNFSSCVSSADNNNAPLDGSGSAQPPANSIFAFWDDLYSSCGYFNDCPNIYYTTIGSPGSRKFIVQWSNTALTNATAGPPLGTFQVILYEGSNNIQLQYRYLMEGATGRGGDATVGIAKDTSNYKLYSYLTQSLTSGQAIRFSPSGGTYTMNSSAAYDPIYLIDAANEPAAPVLSAPADGATNVSLGDSLTWQAATGANDYQVVIATSPDFDTGYNSVGSNTIVGGSAASPSTSLNLSQVRLRPSTTYYWYVMAEKDLAIPYASEISPVASFTTAPPGEVDISNCAQLEAVGPAHRYDTLRLTQDIDCSGIANFTPIGSSWSYYFAGTLDGQRHTISNLTIGAPGPTAAAMGLFVGSVDATFKDVTLSGGTVYANCGANPNCYAGALVAFQSGGSVSNVHSSLQIITVGIGSAGGLVGVSDSLGDTSTSFIDSGASGDVQVTAYTPSAGGLVGEYDADSSQVTFQRTYATGNVLTSGTGCAGERGGLVGTLSADQVNSTLIEDSYAQGNVTGDCQYGGGLVGTLFGNAIVRRTYSSGTVHGTLIAGGLVGAASTNFATSGSTYTNDFTASQVIPTNGSTTTGGLIADFFDANQPLTQTNNYFDIGPNAGIPCSAQAGGCTTVNAGNATPNYFKNNHTNPPLDTWDFANVWNTVAAGYPTLQPAHTIPPASPPPTPPSTPPATSTTSQPVSGASPKQPTTAGLSNNLQLQVNLTEGQTVTGTYKVVVSPASTAPGSFDYDSIEFFVDSTRLYTFYPDNSGTASHIWDTVTHPGKIVTVVAYKNGVPALTLRFDVTVKNPTKHSMPLMTGNGRPSTGLWVTAEQRLRSVPPAVAEAIPYLLLLLLLILLCMLLYQSNRERLAAARAASYYKRAQRLAEEKDGFIALTSHYLRTPLTLIKGGVDLLDMPGESPVAPDVRTKLTAAVTAFGTGVESLLTRTKQGQVVESIVSPTTQGPASPYKSPLFWAPILAVGLLAVLFDVVFVNAGVYSANWINFATQIVLYAVLITGLYITLRGLYLARHEHQRAKEQADQQVALDAARNRFIRDSASELTTQLHRIQEYSKILPAGSVGQKTFVNGCSTLAGVLDRFTAVSTITPAADTTRFARFDMNTLLIKARERSSAQAQQKQVTITSDGAPMLASQQPVWVTDIVSSLLDNAVDYAPEHTAVIVDAAIAGKTATITVEDRGKGIPAERISELSQPFAKVEAPTNFDHPGIGLSLYMDRLFATAMGGQLHIASANGNGTSVSLSFPVR